MSEIVLEDSKTIHNKEVVYSRENITFSIYMLDLPEVNDLSSVVLIKCGEMKDVDEPRNYVEYLEDK